MRQVEIKVAGAYFRQESINQLRGDETCVIIPEPSNPHDPNALRVEAAHHHIGYIPAVTAAELAPLLDGRPLDVEAMEIIPTRRGIEVYITVEIPDDWSLPSLDEAQP